MKPQLIGTKKRPSVTSVTASEVALSLQEELVAAIHGAFEVAVEIAVREVTELVGQATGDIYEEMRRENETLKQRLRRAEAMLEEGGGSTPAAQQTDQHHLNYSQIAQKPKADTAHSRTGGRGETPPAGHSCAHQSPPDHKGDCMSRSEEQRSDDVRTQLVSDAASDLEKERNNGCAALIKDVTEEISPACVVKVESINQPCQDLAAQHHCSPPLPNSDDEFTTEQVTVKQEKPEEERSGSACCLDSIKVEDFSPECMSTVQSTMLEEWRPEVQNIHRQDLNTQHQPAGTRPTQAHPSNVTTGVTPSIDLPSLSSEFPNIFQLVEPAPIQEASPQVFGVHVRSSRNLGHTIANLYTCKSCGQTFHLPSLLRRHYGQCQQKLQQRFQQPVAGSKRTRLQLYPPGCSPFRCTECNREFNRMENLKTHLRIHTGERPYTCSVCSKCFRHSGALTRHFRIHTGEKPYICGQCGKSFRNCGGLKFHQRSHSK